jgi:putative ABC transport system ATP-binding protein
MPLIELSDLWKIYRSNSRGRVIEVEALKGIELKIDYREYLAITGPSGSGKSTLMHQIGLLDSPTSGSYYFEGQDVAGINEEEKARLRNVKIGFVFQGFFLLPRLTLLRNIELPLTYRRISSSERRQRAEAAISQVSLSERLHHYPDELSGGEQQRAAIARAIVQEPQIILADEPTGNLDIATGQKILLYFDILHEKGATIIIVTHNMGIASRAQRTIEMCDGKIL